MIQKTDYFDRVINAEITRHNLAGANLLLLHNNQVLYQKSYGMANMEKKIPMKPDSLFRIFSMSKPITCAAVMLLMERGVLDLYDAVSDYLPGFAHQTVLQPDGSQTPVSRDVRIRDLLNMTSGLSYPDDCTPVGKKVAALFDEMMAAQEQGCGYSTVKLANLLGRLPLAYEPGTKWQYSTSADILGAIVEVASGMKFSDFLKKEFFIPLEMKDTDFYVPEDKRYRFTELYRCSEMPSADAGESGTSDCTANPSAYIPAASGHSGVVGALAAFHEKGSQQQMMIRPQPGKNLGMEGYEHAPAFESGGAGLISSIEDYAHFTTMLLQKGYYNGKQLLSPRTVSFMCSPQLDASFKPDLNWDSMRGYNYGNLMRHLVNPAEGGTNAVPGEFGWDGWCGTYFTIDPADNFIMLYFIQRCDAGSNEVTRRLRNIAYSLL